MEAEKRSAVAGVRKGDEMPLAGTARKTRFGLRAKQGGELRDGGVAEQCRERQGSGELAVDPREQAQCEQRVTPESEEVVVAADLRDL